MALTLDEVVFAYERGADSGAAALRGVSMSVGRGSLVLVLGETGSGKSTLLRMAAGLIAPDRGSAAIDGEPLWQVARGKVGLVFQDAESQLFADTLIEDVAFGPRNLGAGAQVAEQAARETLRQVGLDPEAFGGRSPFAISGGEARRAAIAGVLAMRPDYLLADEPTAGLDAGGRADVRRLLLAARETAGVVVVSHSVDEFLGLADSVLIMRSGRVAWSGTAEALIAEPSPLTDAGLEVPDVLEVQRLAASRGLSSEAGFALDVAEAARRLAAGRGWSV